MADEKDKPSTIDDLVKQLSNQGGPKPSSPGANQPPPNLPGVKLPAADVDKSVKPQGPVPPPPMPPRPPIPPRPPVPTRPQSSLVPTPPSRPQEKPAPAPQQPAMSGAGRPIQEYRSSIRTMGEDITSIKSGQKPSGVDVPRKVTPEAPKAPLPGAPKPAPLPTGPRPSVGLGRAERTGSLPTVPGAKRPEEPAKPPKPPGQTRLGEPEIQPSISIPKEKKGISTTFYLLIAGVLVIGGFLYWFLVLRVPAPPEVVVSPTPTLTQTVTPTPVIKDLSNIFTGTPVNFEVVLSDDVSGDFKTFVDTLTVVSGDFLKVDLVQDVDGTLVPLDWLDMFDMDLTVYPFGLRDEIVDSATLVYGQTEMFNAEGVISFDAQNIKKTVLVARVSDAAAVETMMTDWELTIADDLADYLLIDDTSKEESVDFLDNAYRGISIRYKNFPFPDTTIDYAIVESASQSYLVIASSREAMYTAIDVLMAQ